MKNNSLLKIVLLSAFFMIGSCETYDLDQLDNPSSLPQNQLDPLYVFNYVQLTLPDFVDSANSFTQRVTRQMAMTGGNSYNNAFAPVNFDNNWTTGYLMLNAIKTMEPRAIENNQTFILGASKIIRCYVLMTMVDMYGNIPYSEALQGNANLTPRYDDSASVYAGIYNELNQAIAYLSDPSPTLPELEPRDLYYGNDEGSGDKSRWIILANTLKFKMLNNARLVGNIGGIDVASEMTVLASVNLIDTPSEDFAFKYGTNRVNPNSRHPQYNDHYELGGGAYIANYFLWVVSEEKGPAIKDPREEFYFFEQVGSLPNIIYSGALQAQIIPCRSAGSEPEHYDDNQYNSFFVNSIQTPFCVSGPSSDSYLGRDHGDNSGIPADEEYRTVVGLYPAGGAFGPPINVNSNVNAGEKGALGQGIMPILLSSFVHFIKAEAMLTGVLTGNAKDELILGVTESIDKSTKPIGAYPALTGAQISTIAANKASYLSFIGAQYDDATSTARRLELIIKEYYIAAWGNGIEPYNNYRRTGFPSNFQPTVEPNPGDYFYTALYPGASVNNNPNAPANVRTKKVFWDVANLELH